MALNVLEKAFNAFSKFGNTKSDGKTILLSQIDKWFKQAGIFGNNLTTTDTGIAFNKFKGKTIDFDSFLNFLRMLCDEKKLKFDDIVNKLAGVIPGTTNTTAAQQTGVVERLTDHRAYTGSHKERFDKEGKGRGIEGRADIRDSSGYVSGYKNKDTFSQQK